MRCQTCVIELEDLTEVLEHVLHHLNRLETAMSEINTDQAHLDADVQALGDVLSNVEAEIAALKAQPAAAALDFTAIDAVVARGKGDETPAPPAPVADPTPTPADPSVPADPAAPTGGLESPTPPPTA